MGKIEIIELFKKSGALLTGHFKLSSGLHSGQYLQCALVLQHPDYAALIGQAIAARFKDKGVTCVAGPAIGGIIIAHEAAKALEARCVFSERINGKMALRRGFRVEQKDNVLVVEDVMTTGGSIKELISLAKAGGAGVAGAGAIVDRSTQRINLGCNYAPLIKMDIQAFPPSRCPLCKDGAPIIKPGSRK